jgi:hypothetical protein
MKSNKFSLFLAAAMVVFSVSIAMATNVIFSDFSSTAGLTLNGNTTTPTTGDGTVLRLVPATYSQSGSAFSSVTINAATFSTAFQFRLTNPGGSFDGTGTGADGFVFVVQNVSNSIGGGGGGLGYQGIGSSVGVEFDTWYNGWDPNSNHLGIDTLGNVASLTTVNVSPNFDDGSLWYGWIDYDGTTLEVRANQTGTRPASPLLSSAIDIPDLIGSNTAYVGFTAGTGAAFENHDIISWQYHDSYSPIGTVPEPVTVLLLGLGLVGLAGVRRFKK